MSFAGAILELVGRLLMANAIACLRAMLTASHICAGWRPTDSE